MIVGSIGIVTMHFGVV